MDERHGFKYCVKLPHDGTIVSVIEKGYVSDEEGGGKIFCADEGDGLYVIDYRFELKFKAFFSGYKMSREGELIEIINDKFESPLRFANGLSELFKWQNALIENLRQV